MQPEELTLTADQQVKFSEIETNITNNFLIQGKPGVGKSVLINSLVNNGNKTYTLAAPTGLAALNIGGRTLHSMFKIPVSSGILAHDFNKFNQDDRIINFVKFNIRTLIIDEVSMVRADVLDYVERFIRFCKGNDKPFGGIQIVMVGDFYQLAPVVVGYEKKQLKDAGYDSPFVFSSRAYENGNFKMLELTEVLRQKGDPAFIDLLDRARTGRVTTADVAKLNEHVGKPEGIVINLCATNAQADEVNKRELSRITEKPRMFVAAKFGEWPALPAEELLTLKVGAQVMVKMNGADREPGIKGVFDSKVVNGTLGKVIDIPEGDDVQYVTIELENGDRARIYKKRWERKIKERVGTEWDERIVASYEQIPLALAWAISMHKSQGQSFDKVFINAEKIFAPGQFYVAISRCRSLAGITFASEVRAKQFWANAHVLRFFNN